MYSPETIEQDLAGRNRDAAVHHVRLFEELHNYLYTNSNLPRAEKLGGELVRLLFCKLHDERTHAQTFEGLADAPMEAGSTALRELFEEVKKDYPDLFSSGEVLALNDSALVEAGRRLCSLQLSDAPVDVIGVAFEEFIGPALRGEKGQFFTPRTVVDLCVQMLDPQPDHRIIDPACGSGGFLIRALHHLADSQDETKDRDLGALATSLYGVDKELDLVRIAKTHLALLGDGRSHVFCADSLSPPSSWPREVAESVNLSTFDIVMTNPPFGAKIPIADRSVLSQYQLAHKWLKDGSGWGPSDELMLKQVPQILFIERCLQLLRPGGRLAIVLPDGVLGNPSDGYVGEYIRGKARVLAVVSCPPETFLPSTHTKTSVLLLEKDEAPQQGRIFMAIANTAGHDKNGKPLLQLDGAGAVRHSSAGVPMIANDLPTIATTFRRKRFPPTRTGFWTQPTKLQRGVLIPEYYDPAVAERLERLGEDDRFALTPLSRYFDRGDITVRRGNEVGSRYYGLGPIPFVRTSDIVNWEIKADPIKSLPLEIYEKYRERQDIQEGDILLVADGTFLIGRTAMITDLDLEIVYQSHLRRVRVEPECELSSYLFFYLFNTAVVQGQIKSKTFIQATISTIGDRLGEVVIPVPRDATLASRWERSMRSIIEDKAAIRRRSQSLIEI